MRVISEITIADGETVTVKRCRVCKESKPLLTSFHKDRSKPDGYSNRCKVCNRAHAKAYHDTLPRSKKLEWERLHHYGITQAQFDAMMVEQDGKCAICKSEGTTHGKLFVDHCHETDVVRGLLCAHCNTGIGALGDDIARLHAAIAYLTSNQAITPARPPRKRRAPINVGKRSHVCAV